MQNLQQHTLGRFSQPTLSGLLARPTSPAPPSTAAW